MWIVNGNELQYCGLCNNIPLYLSSLAIVRFLFIDWDQLCCLLILHFGANGFQVCALITFFHATFNFDIIVVLIRYFIMLDSRNSIEMVVQILRGCLKYLMTLRYLIFLLFVPIHRPFCIEFTAHLHRRAMQQLRVMCAQINCVGK